MIKIGEQATRESLEKINDSLPLYRRIVRFAGRFINRGLKG